MAPLTFADTHNTVAFLSKSDASAGFDQIIDFLNAHTIKYALVVNPTIYLSCIKQFWATATVKKVNDDVQLRTLIDGKKVVVSEAIIRIDLHLDDADGCLSAKRTAWNEFSCSMASVVICLATGRKFNFSKYIFDSMVRNVESPSFSSTETPLFASMLVQPQPQAEEGVEIPIAPAPPSTTSSPSPPTLQDPTPTPHATPPQDQPLTHHASPPQDQPTTSHESSIPILTTLIETCATLFQKITELLTAFACLAIIFAFCSVFLALPTATALNFSWFHHASRFSEEEGKEARKEKEINAFRVKKIQKGWGKIAAIDADEGITLVDVETNEEVVAMDVESHERLNQEDVNAASKGVSAVSAPELVSIAEPTKIIRVGGITEAYQIFEDILKGFDREDLVVLWNLVKEKFSSAVPREDKEKALWVKLKRLFEPDVDDVLWKLQIYMHAPLTWKLYSDCGVHHVSSIRGHDIFMLTEKDYHLSNVVMILMLSGKLQVEEDNEMARDLVMKIFMEANKPRSKILDTSL
nr:hypothetical protein [Tanacetum cinerariifolium]